MAKNMPIFNKPLTILIVPDKSYPLTHALLDHIYCRRLPLRGHTILWLLKTLEPRKFADRQMLDKTEVYLFPIKSGEKGQNRTAILANIIYYKPRGITQILKIVRERKVDIVMVRNDLGAGILSFFTCKMFGARFVYYLGFPWLEGGAKSAQRIWPKMADAFKIMLKIGIWIQDWLTKQADFVFTMSDYWRQNLIMRLDLSPNRVKALPFGFDNSIHPNKVSGKNVRLKYRLGNHPTLLYLGSINPSRNMIILAKILARVVSYRPDVRCLILVGIGNWEYLPHLKKAFADHGVLKHARFCPPVSHERVPEFIAAADIGLSPIEPIPLYNVSSPAKLVEMMGMACPVVASETPEQKSIIKLSQAGICVPYNADAFAQAIIHLLNNPNEAKEMGHRGRHFVEVHRSFDSLSNMVEQVFSDLAAK